MHSRTCLPARASDGDHRRSCTGFQNSRQRRRSLGRIDESGGTEEEGEGDGRYWQVRGDGDGSLERLSGAEVAGV